MKARGMNGNRIKELREARQLNTTQLAYELGTTTDTIRRWEREFPPTHRVVQIAAFFDVSPAYVMGWADEEKAA